jgi:hypothetical protein
VITKYVGLFCVSPTCGKFNVLTTYEVERLEQVAASCRPLPLRLTCNDCGDSRIHPDEGVAHALSPDGAEPQYPNRR